MKNMKRILALLIAVLMIATMVPAFAAETTNGSITIHSPIMGAKYTGYKVFDMTMNAAGNAFSYTIHKDSKFYAAVVEYAKMPASGEDTNADGLTLVATNADPDTYNIVATDAFDAKAFGEFLEKKIRGYKNENNQDVAPTITDAQQYYPAEGKKDNTVTAMNAGDAVTVATSSSVTFKNLPYGYYLILSDYPKPEGNVTLEYGKEGDADHQKWEFTDKSTDEDIAAAAAAYAAKVVDDAYVDQYIADHPEFKGTGTDGAITAEDKASLKNQLIASMTEDAKAKINTAIAGSLAGSQADDNTLTERLVFIDTTTPNADIIEKNETHKWDVPVNPIGEGDLKPHGEPSGGKNIVIKEATDDSPAIYADWTEANIGDKVHYQLSVNAVNFERTSTNPVTVKQIKEYVIADFENKNMTYVPKTEGVNESGIKVTIVKKQADGTQVELSGPTDYSAWADKFFHNDAKGDLGQTNGKYDSLFTGNDKEGGLVIPWVELVVDEQGNPTKPTDMTNVTVTKKESNREAYMKAASEAELTPVQVAAGWHVDQDGYVLDENDEKIRMKKADGTDAFEYDEFYFRSLYPNDVTILVDYWMILNDTATIDDPGNINISQYGVTFIDDDDDSYTPPQPTVDVKPDEEKEHDDAKVFTYALAIHKVDEQGRDLAGAEFQIKGLTATKIEDGWYKVSAFDSTDTEFDTETTLTTDTKGWLIVEGLMTSQEVEIQETQAPDGYNKLTGTVKANPKKIGETVRTTSTVITKDDKGDETKRVVTETLESSTVQGGKLTIIKVTTTEAGKAPVVTYEKVDSEGDCELTLNAALKNAPSFTIENKKGTELPSTGGMGTTLFYIGGGILVVLAIVMLVTKRRMSSND